MTHSARLALFLLSGLLVIGAPAMAGTTTRGVTSSAPLSQTYTWYDGQREQTVWINPTLVAEFEPVKEAGESPLKQAQPTARALPGKAKGVRLWHLDGLTTPTSMTRSLNTTHPQGKFSPVMHDTPSAASRMRALPGNIIVYLNPTWNEAQISAWLDSRGLTVVKKLEIGTNIYIIKTDPGLAALELANTLYHSGEVVAAFPDWWQETVTR